jgi:cobalt-precorrin-5B (C1)-methyltransferase
VKLAEGHLDTHSHKITMNLDFIRQLAQEASVSIPALDGLNMARELWDILSADAMQRFATVIIHHCHEHCDPLLPNGILDILLISENGQILTQQ